MYMLIPMDFIILGNYVYVDSTGFLNAYKLCISWFQYIFLILANYVYVDSNGLYNTCKLCICWFNWVFECL